MSPTVAADPAGNDSQDVTCSGARRRHDSSLVGQLNAEWARLRADPQSAAAVAQWAGHCPALAGCAGLGDVEAGVTGGPRQDADAMLLGLLRIGQAGEPLAARTVLQLMLGKAVRIAATHAGRDTRDDLEHLAVSALWTVIATYPVRRRPAKVAANIAMETLRHTVGELSHQRHESPASPDELLVTDTRVDDDPPDLELLNLLAWAVGNNTISAQDATLILDIYAPAAGDQGGAAAATRHGISWAAARQRASRAVRRIGVAIHADSPAPGSRRGRHHGWAAVAVTKTALLLPVDSEVVLITGLVTVPVWVSRRRRTAAPSAAEPRASSATTPPPGSARLGWPG